MSFLGESIKCYTGDYEEGDYEQTDCPTNACLKTIIGGSKPVRACSSKTVLGDGCTENETLKTFICSCTRDLCNAGTKQKMSAFTQLFVSILSIYFIPKFLKHMYAWAEMLSYTKIQVYKLR